MCPSDICILSLCRHICRYLVEPVSGQTHIRTVLSKRFLSFIQQIEKGPKLTIKHIMKTIKHDVRSTTGSNLRNIIILKNHTDIEQLTVSDAAKIKYHPIHDEEVWRVGLIDDLINIIHGCKDLENLENSELLEILDHVCVN